MRVRALGVLALVVILITQAGSGATAGQTAPGSGDAKRFVGTWRLVEYDAKDPAAPNRGTLPTGLIYYDGLGNMAAQIMPVRVRPKYAGTLPTPEEARAAIIGYTAYFGAYTVDERARTITHHRTGSINPGQVGGHAVRRYEFVGDRVVLTPIESGNQLTWERLK